MVIEPWKYGSKIKIKLGNQITKLQLPKKAGSLWSQVQKSWESWFIGGLYEWMMVLVHGFYRIQPSYLTDSDSAEFSTGTQGTSDRKGMRIQKNRTLANFVGKCLRKANKKDQKKRLETSSKHQKVFDDSTNPATYIRYFNISITPWVW